MSAHRCRTLELAALFGVLDGHVQRPRRGAHAVDDRRDPEAVDRLGHRARRVTGAEPMRRGVGERHRGELAGAVDGGRGHDLETRCIAGDDEGAELAGGRRRGHDDRVRRDGVRNVPLLARDPPFTTGCDGARLGGTGERDGPDRLARREPAQQLGVIVFGARQVHQARRADGAGRERTGMHFPTELFEHDGHVDHAHARAAERVGHQQAGRAEPRESRPHGVGRPALVVQHLAHERDLRLLGEESPYGRAQQLLILAELEVQGAGL
jgi:hypothetical protein